jgi:hypothetical protein
MQRDQQFGKPSAVRINFPTVGKTFKLETREKTDKNVSEMSLCIHYWHKEFVVQFKGTISQEKFFKYVL